MIDIKKALKRVGKTNVSNDVLISLFEVFVTGAIGILFYWPLDNKVVAWVVWAVGLLFMLSRVLTIHQLRSSLQRQNDDLNRLAKVIDIRSSCNVDGVSKLLDTYLNITEPEFRRVKDSLVAEALEKLNNLRHERRSGKLVTSEYYEWLLPILDTVGKGNTIKAVSCMFNAEWDDSSAERKFIEGNLAAADKGAMVERVFISTLDTLREAVNNEAISAHCLERYQETKLTGYYVDIEKLKTKEPDLVRMAGDGFIIFNSRVALVDDFDQTIRGRVTMNESEIHTLERTFDRLRVHASRLSKRLIETPVIAKAIEAPKHVVQSSTKNA